MGSISSRGRDFLLIFKNHACNETARASVNTTYGEQLFILLLQIGDILEGDEGRGNEVGGATDVVARAVLIDDEARVAGGA